MKKKLTPNIGNQGRLFRGFGAVGLFVGAGLSWHMSTWLSGALAASGLFVLFEALRGWCAVRACGIKTRF